MTSKPADLIKHALNLHENIARDVCKDDIYRLHCSTCDDIEVISAKDFAHYLRTGWPKCCGQTKTLEKEPR